MFMLQFQLVIPYHNRHTHCPRLSPYAMSDLEMVYIQHGTVRDSHMPARVLISFLVFNKKPRRIPARSTRQPVPDTERTPHFPKIPIAAGLAARVVTGAG